MEEHHVQSGPERDILVMVDQDGQRTLFRLVEVEDAHDVLRLASDPHLPVVVIDAVVPPTGAHEASPGASPGPPRATLIVVNLRRANDADAAGFVAYKSRTAERIATFEWHMPPPGEERDR
jgi:hypothetical protein